MEDCAFEVVANGHSYGIYVGTDKDAAMLAHVIDAGYEGVEDAADRVGQTEQQFLSEFKVEELTVKDIRLNISTELTPAIFFTVNYGDKEVDTLEWLTEDGELEKYDSQLDSMYLFTSQALDHIRSILEHYLAQNVEAVEALWGEAAEVRASAEDDDNDNDGNDT